MMNKTIRLLIVGLGVYALIGCGQPGSNEQEHEQDQAAAETATGGEQLASIDEDGNIAPFGFASKQPVEVADPEAEVVAEAETAEVSELYGMQCVACHGADAAGVEGLGLNLIESDMVASSSADELAGFLKIGRPADSPDSVTGVPMPAFAWMNDEQLAEITGYLKSLQK